MDYRHQHHPPSNEQSSPHAEAKECLSKAKAKVEDIYAVGSSKKISWLFHKPEHAVELRICSRSHRVM